MENHLGKYRQMLFLSGPRQVGKTTLAKEFATDYLDWDNIDVRTTILRGADAIAVRIGIDRLVERKVVAFDEIHKNPRWKDFLKGFFDTYEDRLKLIATGSARMDISFTASIRSFCGSQSQCSEAQLAYTPKAAWGD